MDFFIHFNYFGLFIIKVLNIVKDVFLINFISLKHLCFYLLGTFINCFSFKKEILNSAFKKPCVSMILHQLDLNLQFIISYYF